MVTLPFFLVGKYWLSDVFEGGVVVGAVSRFEIRLSSLGWEGGLLSDNWAPMRSILDSIR